MKIIVAHSKKYGDKEILVDDNEYEMLCKYSWSIKKHGRQFYPFTNIEVSPNKRRPIKIHRLIMNLQPFQILDHIDGNALNNQRNNLRLCDQKSNTKNVNCHIDNKIGYKGIAKRDQKFQAIIFSNGKRIYLGRHTAIKDAVIAYNNAALKYHGEFARLNII